MTIGYKPITFDNKKLYLKNVNKRKVLGTIKQKVGGRLIKYDIPGRSVRDTEISGRGIIFDTEVAATTQRKELQELYDYNPYDYVDGIDDGEYIIARLEFDDDSNNPLSYEYNIRFIQFQQAL